MALLVTAAVPAADVVRQLPMPADVYGLIAICSFLLALGVLWMFRGAAARYGQRQASGRGGAPQGHRPGSQPGAPH